MNIISFIIITALAILWVAATEISIVPVTRFVITRLVPSRCLTAVPRPRKFLSLTSLGLLPLTLLVPYTELILNGKLGRYNEHQLSCCGIDNFIDPRMIGIWILLAGLISLAHISYKNFHIISKTFLGLILVGLVLGVSLATILLIHLLGRSMKYCRDDGAIISVALVISVVEFSRDLSGLIRSHRISFRDQVVALLDLPTIYGISGLLFSGKINGFFLSLQNSHGYGFSTIPSCIPPTPCYLCTVSSYMGIR